MDRALTGLGGAKEKFQVCDVFPHQAGGRAVAGGKP